jgi:hypothetical protein
MNKSQGMSHLRLLGFKKLHSNSHNMTVLKKDGCWLCWLSFTDNDEWRVVYALPEKLTECHNHLKVLNYNDT